MTAPAAPAVVEAAGLTWTAAVDARMSPLGWELAMRHGVEVPAAEAELVNLAKAATT